MAQAKTGDTVRVHYTGKLDDGTIFDTSADREPLQFKIGEGQLIADFEQAVVGMNPGESKTIQITSENAYGPRHQEMVLRWTGVTFRMTWSQGLTRDYRCRTRTASPLPSR